MKKEIINSICVTYKGLIHCIYGVVNIFTTGYKLITFKKTY